MSKISTAGIIIELNPLHNGHCEHIRETRRITGRTHIVAIMSGNFVQRGEPALIDKWARTEMALRAGVDVVIELPLPYVLGGADYFARGAVRLLYDTGVVDCLCFGSESGDVEALKRGARILATEPPLYKKVLRTALDAGRSFAAARGAGLTAVLSAEVHTPECKNSIMSCYSMEDLIILPNNGLGMEYIKALEQLGHPMEIFTTHRKPGGVSATVIRKSVAALREHAAEFEAGETEIKKAMPDFAYNMLREIYHAGNTVFLDDFSDIFRYELCRGDTPPLEEGLHHRFLRYIYAHRTLSNLLSVVKTKRYTFTRLQRAAMRIILNIDPPANDPPYIRILGFRKQSAHLISEIMQRAHVPVLTHHATTRALLCQNKRAAFMLEKEWEAGALYRLMQRTNTRPERSQPLVRI